MKRFFQGLSLASLCLALTACGSAKYYTLPTDPSLVRETQTMIGTCATEAGLESQKSDELVMVKYDETAMLYYRYGGDDSFQVQIVLDDKRINPKDLDKKHAVVKAKGDDVYACAQTRVQGGTTVTPHVAAPPAPRQPASGMSMQMDASPTGMSVNVQGPSGYCAQALDCYSQLSRTVCANSTGKCSFKAEISGNDESGCRDALLNVPELLQPFQMMQPGLKAPAVCTVR